MNDVELEVSKGSLRFRGRGPQEWVEAQFAKLFSDIAREAGSDEHAGDDEGNQSENLIGQSQGGDRKARWMAQQNVTQDQIDHVFHFNGTDLDFIVSTIPGASNKDRSINIYILVGLRNTLVGKEGRFTDDEARGICTQYGVYDKNNHAKVLNSLKPEITGSKGTGWQLTAPGLAKAALLVKQMGPST